MQGWGENDRGVSFTFGPDVVAKFLNRHDLDLICRAHQVIRIILDFRILFYYYFKFSLVQIEDYNLYIGCFICVWNTVTTLSKFLFSSWYWGIYSFDRISVVRFQKYQIFSHCRHSTKLIDIRKTLLNKSSSKVYILMAFPIRVAIL